jgi:integrase
VCYFLSMGRPRFQRGWVTEQGPNWRGEFYIQEISASGEKKRAHKSVVLGQRDKITKSEAKRLLYELILKETKNLPPSDVPLRTFIQTVWLPRKAARWKASTYSTNVGILKKQIIEPLGEAPLSTLDRSRLQMHLNGLAQSGYSFSVVQHTNSFLRAIFDEALEQELISKNPARKLELPQIQDNRVLGIESEVLMPDLTVVTEKQIFPSGKPFLSLPQLRRLIAALNEPYKLIGMLAALCAMRIGEILALTWDAYDGRDVFIAQRIYRGKIDRPKTKASLAFVPLPDVVKLALEDWKARQIPITPGDFIFSKNGRPLSKDGYLRGALHSASEQAGLPFEASWQIFRRTWASHIPAYGADLKTIEVILRHSASQNFSVGTYQQGIRERILESMNRFANDVMSEATTATTPDLPMSLSGSGGIGRRTSLRG